MVPDILFYGANIWNSPDEKRDFLLTESGIDFDVSKKNKETIEVDLNGKMILPALTDIHAHLRVPGQEEKESILTGTQAAAKGGITTLVAMPNTFPVMDRPDRLKEQLGRLEKEAVVEVLQASSMTLDRQAKEVVDFRANSSLGVRIFTDDGSGINQEPLMQEIARAAKEAGVLLMEHPENHFLSGGAACSYGKIADLMGIKGQSAESESLNILKFGTIAGMSGARIHFTHISTRASVEAIRMLKKLYPRLITADATPHHLLLSEEDNLDLSGDKKMNPPLRPESDRESVEQALLEGVIDCVATDHAPHTPEEKRKAFEKAPFGVIGFETFFASLYTHFVLGKKASLSRLLDWIAFHPAQIIGREKKKTVLGMKDFIVVDLNEEWMVRREDFVSKSSNSAFLGMSFSGRVKQTFWRGKQVYVEA